MSDLLESTLRDFVRWCDEREMEYSRENYLKWLDADGKVLGTSAPSPDEAMSAIADFLQQNTAQDHGMRGVSYA